MSNSLFHLEVVTPNRRVFPEVTADSEGRKESNDAGRTGMVSKIVLNSVLGEICILPGHAALLALLDPGVIRIEWDGGKQFLAADAGFVQVQGDNVNVFVDGAWTAEELPDLIEEDEPDGHFSEKAQRAAKLRAAKLKLKAGVL